MYVLQEMPGKEVVLKNGSLATPIATLKDEHGGISHIIVDDHCYVLVNGGVDREFVTVKHWYPEAVAAMKYLNPQPAQAEEPSMGELVKLRGDDKEESIYCDELALLRSIGQTSSDLVKSRAWPEFSKANGGIKRLELIHEKAVRQYEDWHRDGES